MFNLENSYSEVSLHVNMNFGNIRYAISDNINFKDFKEIKETG